MVDLDLSIIILSYIRTPPRTTEPPIPKMPAAAVTFRSTEKPDLVKLRTLLDNWDDINLEPSCRDQWEVKGKTYDPIVLLKKYFMRHRPAGIPVTYRNSAKAQTHGRQYAVDAVSMQSFSRAIRHTLAAGNHHDIDMVNAHPTIFLQYCEKKGYACDNIRYYIDHRDECLDDLIEHNECTREDAKRVLLSLLNGGRSDFTALAVKPKWLNDFKDQVETIQKIVTCDPDMQALLKSVKRGGKEFNIRGSVCNHVLCDIENELLMACMKFLKSRNIPVANVVLVFDGFMMPTGLCEITEAWLGELASFVANATGYTMQFLEKPIDEPVDLTGFAPKEAEGTPVRIATDDNSAANIFMGDVQDRIRKCNGDVYMRMDDHVWTSEFKLIKQVLLQKVLESNICSLDMCGNTVAYSASVPKAKNIIDALIAKLPDDPCFVEMMWHSTLGKICFVDGVYYFAEKQFKRWDEVTDVYTTLTIKRNFPAKNEDIMREVHTKILETVFESKDKRDSWLRFIARGLAGHVEDKLWAVCMGERNCGKGILVDGCKAACGDYVNTTNTENFLIERMGGGDQAKKEAWMKDCTYSRLTFSNEITLENDNNKHKINGNMIKRFASGGDELRARKLFENASAFKVQSRMCMNCNDLPPITPADATETLVMFKFPYKFVHACDMTDPLPFFRVRDEGLKGWFKRPEVCDAFVHIIIDAYQSHALVLDGSIKRDTMEYRQDAGDELMIMRTVFKFTGGRNDYVTLADLKRVMAQKQMNISLNCAKERLKKLGGVDGQHKVDGKNVRGFFGIKYVDEDDEELDEENDI